MHTREPCCTEGAAGVGACAADFAGVEGHVAKLTPEAAAVATDIAGESFKPAARTEVGDETEDSI
jgi:hypothetical protein